MKKLSKLVSPAIAGVVRQKNKYGAIAQIKNCCVNGADMIDLHMSCLEETDEETLKEIISSTVLPVLALNYNKDVNWENSGFTETQRAELFLRAVSCGASGIDMQGYTFDEKSKNGFFGEDKYIFTKNNPKEIVTDKETIQKQCEFIERVHDMGAEVLLSCHPNVVMNAEQVVELALFLEKRLPDIIKIVTVAKTDDDLVESFRAMQMLKKNVRTAVSYHVNGKAGSLSRIINPVLGGHMVFCVDRYDEYSTMEQLDLKTVKSIVDGMKRIQL